MFYFATEDGRVIVAEDGTPIGLEDGTVVNDTNDEATK